ncbi:MAG TPA: hypothetical protein VH475_08460 [Tepidisphaeraceae bacterium]|jgi:uncharacterized protein YpmS
MRFAKRLGRILLLVLILGAIGVGVLYHLSTRRPDGYRPTLLSAAERDAAVKRLELEKLPQLLNLANQAQANASSAYKAQAQGRAAPAASTQPIAPVTVTFTQDEINASLWKQIEKSSYERYVTDPYVSLEEGTIVLMGNLPEFGRVASAYFRPTIDEQGLLHCDLTSLRIGSLPVPEGMVAAKRQKVENALRSMIPQWQSKAEMGPSGVVNDNARRAALGQLVLRLLNHKPGPAVLFLPKELERPNKGSVPVRLTNVTVEQGALTITVQPMDAGERSALLAKIREPQSPQSPSGELSRS